jgi:hypothetical protein
MSTPMGLDSDIGDPMAHAISGKRFLPANEDILVFGAKAATLNSLLAKACAPKTVDLLSLDVEGAELEVLRGIDHNEYEFRFICVECRNPERLDKYLKPLGYSLIEQLTGHDFLYRKLQL